MKKLIAFLSVVSVLFCMTACGRKAGNMGSNNTATVDATDNTTNFSETPTDATNNTNHTDFTQNNVVTPIKAPLRMRPTSFPTEHLDKVLERLGTSWSTEVPLDVPVYCYVDLFYSSAGNTYRLGLDSSYGHILNSEPGNDFHSAANHLSRAPTNAIRIREDGTSYAIYDADAGYRLYLSFMTPDRPFLAGYPIVVSKYKEMLSQDNFKSVQIGDPIEEVESIDSIATIHKNAIHYMNLSPKFFENQIEKGNPVVSVHYLKDGLLIIEYTMVEAPNIIVSKISFYEDYVVPTADGKMTSHKIKDIDLPQP